MNQKKKMTILRLSAVLVFFLFTGCNSTSSANSDPAICAGIGEI